MASSGIRVGAWDYLKRGENGDFRYDSMHISKDNSNDKAILWFDKIHFVCELETNTKPHEILNKFKEICNMIGYSDRVQELMRDRKKCKEERGKKLSKIKDQLENIRRSKVLGGVKKCTFISSD
jgi:hypothetical protein